MMIVFLELLSSLLMLLQTQDSILGCVLSGQEDLEEDIDVESLSYQVDLHNINREKGGVQGFSLLVL